MVTGLSRLWSGGTSLPPPVRARWREAQKVVYGFRRRRRRQTQRGPSLSFSAVSRSISLSATKTLRPNQTRSGRI